MPAAYIDRLDLLSLEERNGAIRSLTRKARVIFNPGEPIPTDYTVLMTVLETAGIPLPFTVPAGDGFSSLVLVNRSVQLVENDKSIFDVTLKYDHILDGPNQVLQEDTEQGGIGPVLPNPNDILYGKGRCSIAEKTTNFYIPNGVGDPVADRVLILVAHSFPKSDQGIPTQSVVPGYPYTVFQGGEITLPFPQENFQMQGVIRTSNPRIIAQAFIAKINGVAWCSRPPFTWICSEVQWECLDISTLVYKFVFEFQYNFDTWNPRVVFIDQRTGRPPANLETANQPNPDPTTPDGKAGVLSYTTNPYIDVVQPAGQWNVPALQPVDFNALFGNFLEGFD
jgi:hypothetical protein